MPSGVNSIQSRKLLVARVCSFAGPNFRYRRVSNKCQRAGSRKSRFRSFLQMRQQRAPPGMQGTTERFANRIYSYPSHTPAPQIQLVPRHLGESRATQYFFSVVICGWWGMTCLLRRETLSSASPFELFFVVLQFNKPSPDRLALWRSQVELTMVR